LRRIKKKLIGKLKHLIAKFTRPSKTAADKTAPTPTETNAGSRQGARSQTPSVKRQPPAERAAARGAKRGQTPSPRRKRPPRKQGPTPKAQAPVHGDWQLDQFEVSSQADKTRFHDLALPDRLMHAIADLGFTYCTPIQAGLMPATLAGRDAYGRAQTGTGKTAAFLITGMTRMLKHPVKDDRAVGTPRMLVVAPTRELVLQITAEAEELAKYTRLTIVSIFGGMDYEKQRRQLSDRVIDLIVATPGRLLDFYRRKDLDLGKTEILVLDEADRMLDMGFIPDVRRIVYATPHKRQRQTMLFSATLTDAITRLSDQWTTDPLSVEIEPEQVAVDTVDQKVYIVTTEEKFTLLYNMITKQKLERLLVFCNRRDQTRRLAEMFERYRIDSAILSGDVPQKKRIRTLENFKNGKIRALVATDVAGRGIHIEGMSHVVNFTLPQDPEDYVHRIGRTGRAGATGTSVSFADEEDSFYIPAIETFIGQPLVCTQPPEEWLEDPPPPLKARPKPRSSNRRGRRTGGLRGRQASRGGSSRGGPSRGGAQKSGGNRRQGGGRRAQGARGPRRGGRPRSGAGGSQQGSASS
jgi:ATP-dependent RNA helicase RhlB